MVTLLPETRGLRRRRAATPSASAVGANTVVITATDGDSQASTQSFTITVSNINDVGSVSITGTNAEDSVLTANVADDDGLSGVTPTYTWQSSSDLSTWSSISGANAATFTLTQTQVSSYMRVVVQYTDEDGQAETHIAMLSSTVQNLNDANTAVPTISGTTTEDQVLTASASPLSGNDEDGMTGSSFTYQWQRCTSTTDSPCSHIGGATSSTYTLGSSDAANFIRVGVSYEDDLSTTETVFSTVTAAITNVNDAPSISSTPVTAVNEDAGYSYSITTSDVDPSDTITITGTTVSYLTLNY